MTSPLRPDRGEHDPAPAVLARKDTRRVLVPVPTTADAGLERRWSRATDGREVVLYLTFRHAGHRFMGHARISFSGSVPPSDRFHREVEAECNRIALRELADQVGRHNDDVRHAQESAA